MSWNIHYTNYIRNSKPVYNTCLLNWKPDSHNILPFHIPALVTNRVKKELRN